MDTDIDDVMTLHDIVGQDRPKMLLDLFGETLGRTGRLPNLGVWGSTGMGKTALVTAWGNDMGAEVMETNGTSIGDVMAFREFLDKARKDSGKPHMLFVDEAHGLSKKVQTAMLSMLEAPFILTCVAPTEIGYVMDHRGRNVFIEKGMTLTESLPDNLSVAFATTDPHRLLGTIVNRLRQVEIDDYSVEEIVQIARVHLPRAPQGHLEGIANRNRSVRHMIITLIATYKDIQNKFGKPDMTMLDTVLGIDDEGATRQDLLYLEFLLRNGVSGVTNLASFLRKEPDDVQESIEPYLMRKGWISRTRRGRELTPAGRDKVNSL